LTRWDFPEEEPILFLAGSVEPFPRPPLKVVA
jgi:hypothetical protein